MAEWCNGFILVLLAVALDPHPSPTTAPERACEGPRHSSQLVKDALVIGATPAAKPTDAVVQHRRRTGGSRHRVIPPFEPKLGSEVVVVVGYVGTRDEWCIVRGVTTAARSCNSCSSKYKSKSNPNSNSPLHSGEYVRGPVLIAHSVVVRLTRRGGPRHSVRRKFEVSLTQPTRTHAVRQNVEAASVDPHEWVLVHTSPAHRMVRQPVNRRERVVSDQGVVRVVRVRSCESDERLAVLSGARAGLKSLRSDGAKKALC